MALTEEQVTAQNFKDFYNLIKPYLNYQPTMGFTPVGTIISVMGTHAPAHYLICDGTVYNILDHLELAGYFKEQFGSSNYFGGDGITTFAVPDLRGEFLRGTGTNSHTNQGNGEDVGEHQDATRHLYLWVGEHGLYSRKPSSGDICASNVDDDTYMQSYNGTRSGTGTWTDSTFNNVLTYTSRPTNTSVLYCIAEKNIFIQNYEASNIYSEDERIIGTWINGKPIYQKTIQLVCNNSDTDEYHNFSEFGINDVDLVIDYTGFRYDATSGGQTFFNYTGGGTWNIFIASKLQFVIAHYADWARNQAITITWCYTKTTD